MSAKKQIDDRFKKFGTVSFTSITKINDFVDYLEEDDIMGTKCGNCGAVFFPPRADCHKCLTSKAEWFKITGTGVLVTYSKLEFAPAGFEDDVPYRIALLDYGKFKIFGRIADDVPESEINIGMEMKTVTNTTSNRQLNFVFKKP